MVGKDDSRLPVVNNFLYLNGWLRTLRPPRLHGWGRLNIYLRFGDVGNAQGAAQDSVNAIEETGGRY